MKLYVVGFGPGHAQGMTREAEEAIRRSDLIVGYTVYVDLLRPLFPEKNFAATGMRQERVRVVFALEQAADGKTVALVCSGDSGVYGLAELALTIGAASFPAVDIEIVAGVTAALSGGALLGAPLTHDFAVVSLSDLLTPWETIENRLECAAKGDFVIVLYNPSSRKRRDYLRRACDIIAAHRSPETVCGLVRNIGREGEAVCITTLAALPGQEADMFTTVFIGSSETRAVNGRMVTPRGYRHET